MQTHSTQGPLRPVRKLSARAQAAEQRKARARRQIEILQERRALQQSLGYLS